jgi:hypothetical protein
MGYGSLGICLCLNSERDAGLWISKSELLQTQVYQAGWKEVITFSPKAHP